ncbi:hypothetical protein, partial [Klebsiella pneumoniae]|uniref:hypothetical protein n=1 Tax=Klebsiella pneumoniae TaxID=573 RepID=UPI0027314285
PDSIEAGSEQKEEQSRCPDGADLCFPVVFPDTVKVVVPHFQRTITKIDRFQLLQMGNQLIMIMLDSVQ